MGVVVVEAGTAFVCIGVDALLVLDSIRPDSEALAGTGVIVGAGVGVLVPGAGVSDGSGLQLHEFLESPIQAETKPEISSETTTVRSGKYNTFILKLHF